MDRFIFGILTTIVLLVCVSLVLYSFDRAEIIDLQKGTLLILGHIPGWEELPEELEAGRGRLKTGKKRRKPIWPRSTGSRWIIISSNRN